MSCGEFAGILQVIFKDGHDESENVGRKRGEEVGTEAG